MTRERWTKAFLWIAVLGWGVGLGGKLFDLIVVAGAWAANPPASLALLPYGPRFPWNPGDFFQPLSLIMVVGVMGALIAGWKTALTYRLWLLIPVVDFLLIWIATPTIFWPMIHQLYGASTGKIPTSDADLVRLVHRWILWDCWRVALIAFGFVASIRAISLPPGGGNQI